MLLVWAAWGHNATTVKDKHSHEKKVWKDVVKALADGTLPESIEPVRVYVS